MASHSPYHYVYILRSIHHEHYYVGITQDLRQRLKKHNAGSVPHTAKYRPWLIQTAIAFRETDKAQAYERYLKSHAGRNYAKKHF